MVSLHCGNYRHGSAIFCGPYNWSTRFHQGAVSSLLLGRWFNLRGSIPKRSVPEGSTAGLQPSWRKATEHLERFTMRNCGFSGSEKRKISALLSWWWLWMGIESPSDPQEIWGCFGRWDLERFLRCLSECWAQSRIRFWDIYLFFAVYLLDPIAWSFRFSRPRLVRVKIITWSAKQIKSAVMNGQWWVVNDLALICGKNAFLSLPETPEAWSLICADHQPTPDSAYIQHDPTITQRADKTPQIIPAGGLHGFDGNESPALPREGHAAGALNGAPVRGLVVRHLAIFRPDGAVDGHPIGMLGMPRMGWALNLKL